MDGSQFIAFRQAGAGPAVLLVPGLGGLGRFWEPVMQALPGGFNSIAIDHPGVGASPDFGPQTIEGIAEQAVRLFDHLGIERCAVVGHSTGGLVAQALALDVPQRIARVVLSSTWARPDNRFRDLFRLRQHLLRSGGLEAYEALGRLLAYPADWYEAHVERRFDGTSEGRDQSPARLIDERIEMLLGYDRADELPRLRQPTLVVGARDDNIVPFLHSQDLAARIGHARLVELPGGHFTPTTRTAAYAALLADFLGEA